MYGPFVVVVDGDDVGLGVDVGVGGDGVQQVGHGGEDVLEGDLVDENHIKISACYNLVLYIGNFHPR